MEGSSGSEDSSESACLTDGSEYIPDSESSSEPVELLPVIFNPVSATAKRWKCTIPETRPGTTCMPDAGHGTKETSDGGALQMKAAGLFTETFTGGKQSATTSGVPASSTSCSSTLHQVTSGVPASSTSCSLTLNKVTSGVPASSTSCSSTLHKVTIHVATNHNGQRVYDKKNKCKFCDVRTTNLRKHLFSKKHRHEPEIAEILCKPNNSKERELLLEKVRNQGNYQHNCSVLEEQEGELIPWRSPTEQVDPREYVPCTFCLGFFLRKELWRHENACKFKTDTKKGRRVISRAESLLPCQIDCSQGYRENIIGSMNSDEITFVAKKDSIITRYGEKLYQKHGHTEHKRAYIRQKIREMARFLQVSRQEDSAVTDLQSCLMPCKFPLAVSAARTLCGYDSVKNAYANPSLALKTGHTLKKCAGILRNQALMEGDEALQKATANFIELCESDWKEYVSSCALSTLEGRKYNKPHVLPLTDDLKKVTKHLEVERKKCLSELRSEPTSSTWLYLAKVSLSNIIMFNRRRSGEASRMLISDFEAAKSNSQPEDDILEALSEMEKQLVDNFMRVEVRGKRGRKVPVLLTSHMRAEIEELLLHRQQVGVNPVNKYIFARAYFGSEDHLPGHTCLREAVEASGVAHPQDITSTKLRKHLATVSQILNLNDHELEQVCGFLGHNVSVHREFYRLPQDTFQLAKVSRLLMAAESGQMARFQGKALEDIQLDQDLEFHDSEIECDDVSEAEVEAPKSQTAETEGATHRGRSKQRKKAVKRSQEPSSDEEESVICKRPVNKGKDFLTVSQIDLIRCHFKARIDSSAVPRKAECEDFLKKEPLLQDKSWFKIKCTVRNEIEKRKRDVKRLQTR